MPTRLLLLPAIACLAFAIACGSGGDPDPTPSPSPTPSPTAAPSGSPAAIAGDTDTAFSADRAIAHAEALAVDIGSRPAGSAEELAAADYIRAELAGYGYEAELQAFPIQAYETFRADLEVTRSDGSSQIDAAPLVGSSSGTATAQLVSVGLGYPGDFPAAANGNIVLIERGVIEFSSKVANAEAAGAIAALIYNNERGPFEGQLREMPGVPVVSIAQ